MGLLQDLKHFLDCQRKYICNQRWMGAFWREKLAKCIPSRFFCKISQIRSGTIIKIRIGNATSILLLYTCDTYLHAAMSLWRLVYKGVQTLLSIKNAGLENNFSSHEIIFLFSLRTYFSWYFNLRWIFIPRDVEIVRHLVWPDLQHSRMKKSMERLKVGAHYSYYLI